MDVEPVAPVAPVTPPPEPVAPAESIAAHAEQFNPPKLERVPEERERHRAQSQKATAADAPRIAELTKKWRTEEAEVKRLRAELDALKPAARTAPTDPPPARTVGTPATVVPSTTAAGFPDKEPTLDQFGDKDDPYAAWQRALSAFDRKKERWEEQQAEATTRTTREREDAARQYAESEKAHADAHLTRMQAFRTSHPDFDEKLTAAAKDSDQMPPVLYHAIMRDDNGPEILYHLLTHPVELDDMRLRAEALPGTESSVALLQRRLRHYATSLAAPTGSAAPVAPVTLAPRPPNPVRSGPMKPSEDLRGDASSIADHAKRFAPDRRR